MTKSLCRALFILLYLPLSAAHAQRAMTQSSPRWFADVAVGGNKVVSDSYQVTGWDAALTVGAKARHSASMTFIVAATGHASGYVEKNTSIVCPDVLGYVCTGPTAVLPLADVTIGAERLWRFVGVRAALGPTVHRTKEANTDFIWGTQFRADVLVPISGRMAGVVSVRQSFMQDRIDNRIAIRGVSAGIRVQ